MGITDWFSFKSADQRRLEEKDFQKRVLPLGEEQKQRANGVMQQLFPAFGKDPSEGLFVFLCAKDEYTRAEGGEAGRAQLRRVMRRMGRRFTPDDLLLLERFVEMESEAVSLEVYPTADDVRRSLQNYAGEE